MDRNRENSIHSDSLEGFLSLAWHGAHDNGVGEDRDIDGRVHLAKDVRGGQFDLYFCSTACVRVFFNSWVDALEKAIVCEKKRPPDSPKKLKRFLTDMRKRGLLEE